MRHASTQWAECKNSILCCFFNLFLLIEWKNEPSQSTIEGIESKYRRLIKNRKNYCKTRRLFILAAFDWLVAGLISFSSSTSLGFTQQKKNAINFFCFPQGECGASPSLQQLKNDLTAAIFPFSHSRLSKGLKLLEQINNNFPSHSTGWPASIDASKRERWTMNKIETNN